MSKIPQCNVSPHTLFFYKNKVYKNVEPQICQKVKNILDAEIVIILQLFLIPHMEAENTFSARKVTIFGVFWRNIRTKIQKFVKNFAIVLKN